LIFFVIPAEAGIHFDLRRFSFASSLPYLVIPAKAGIQLLALAFGVVATTDSHPCAFRRASLRAGHFLLLAQEKVTKEKGTPEGAVGRRPTARVRCGGSLTGHPWPDSERARIVRTPLRAFSSADSPRPRGPGRAKQSCFALLLISSPCDAAEGGRQGPKGRREGSRRFRCGPGWPVSGTRPPAANPRQRARHPGALSLGYFSLGKQREVTRSPWMAREKTQGRESVLAIAPKAKARSWIPAFAGMTRRRVRRSRKPIPTNPPLEGEG
jgi:hypothetical protein